jgi:hypothetical protein
MYINEIRIKRVSNPLETETASLIYDIGGSLKTRVETTP